MIRCLLYTRQSIEREEGTNSLSIESQIATLHDHCQREGWHIAGEVREAGLKGWMDADERPGLAEAISRAEAGDYDVLLVWDLSRLARSVRLQEQWVWQFTRYGVEIVSHTEPESADALIRQIKGAVNEYRTREIKASVRRALRTRAQNGWHHGRVPWGYTRPTARAPLAIDPEPAMIVREMFALRAGGIGPAAIAETLTRRGILTPDHGIWSASQVMRLLSHVTYRGAVRCGEELIEEAHPAIVPAELWQRAQERSGNRRAPRRKAVNSPYEGLVEHCCGQPMYLIQPYATKTTATMRCRRAGRGMVDAAQESCPFSPRTIALDRVEALIWERIVDDFTHIRKPRQVMAEARRIFQCLSSSGEAAMRREAAEMHRQAMAKRTRAEELFLTGARDRAWFDIEDARAQEIMAQAEQYLATLPTPPDHDAIEAAWRELADMRSMLRHFEPPQRGQVLRTLGIAILSPAGIRAPHGGAGDMGKVTIRYRPGIDRFLGKYNT